MQRFENIAVTGSQKFANLARIRADFRALIPHGLRRVAQGGHGIDQQYGQEDCPEEPVSADTLAWLATHELGLIEATYRVDRQLDGPWPAAGPKRSVRMLAAEQRLAPVSAVLAYPMPKSKGTWHCVRETLRLGIIVAVWAPHFADQRDLIRALGVDHAVMVRGSRYLLAEPAQLSFAEQDQRDETARKLISLASALEGALP